MRSLPLLPLLDVPDVDWDEVRSNLSLRSIRALSNRRVREELGGEHQAALEKALTLVRSPVPSDVSYNLFRLIQRAPGPGFNTCFENAKINISLGKDVCRQVLLYRFQRGSDMIAYQMMRNDFVYVITNNLFPMAEAMIEKWPSLITKYDTFEIVSPLDSIDPLWNQRSYFLMRMMQRHCFRINSGSRQILFPFCGLLEKLSNEHYDSDHPNNPTTLERICQDDFVSFYECVEKTFPHLLHYKEVVLIMMKHAALTFEDSHLDILEKLADICPSALLSSDGSPSALQVYCKWFFYDEWFQYQPSIKVLRFFLSKAKENYMIADEECGGLLSPDGTDMIMTALQWILPRLLRINADCHNQCLEIIVRNTSMFQIIKRCISDAEEASDGFWDGGNRPKLSYTLPSIELWVALVEKYRRELANLSAEEITIIIYRLNVHAPDNSDDMNAVYTLLFRTYADTNMPFDTRHDAKGRLVLHILLEEMRDYGFKLPPSTLKMLIEDHRRALTRVNPLSGLLPFMEAATIVYRDEDCPPFLSSLSVIYELIRNDPEAVGRASSVVNFQDLRMS